jgi:ASC-1-like (ASCH) protein
MAEGAKVKKPTTEQRLRTLELAVTKMCHYSGQEHILTEFGLEKWTPGKKDMSRWDDVKAGKE